MKLCATADYDHLCEYDLCNRFLFQNEPHNHGGGTDHDDDNGTDNDDHPDSDGGASSKEKTA